MDTPIRPISDLEFALMRHALDGDAASRERCGRCRRVPLVGEHVHQYNDRVLCDLCAERERQPPVCSRLVHGPAWGHSIRVIDQRAAA